MQSELRGSTAYVLLGDLWTVTTVRYPNSSSSSSSSSSSRSNSIEILEDSEFRLTFCRGSRTPYFTSVVGLLTV